MTDWQKAWVRENGGQLFSNTKFDQPLRDKLVEAGVLKEGLSLMNSTCNLCDISSDLYTVLLDTKNRGYETLTKALYECGQTIPAAILLNGMRSQRGLFQDSKIDPLLQCGIKINEEATSKVKVSLRGEPNEKKDFLSVLHPEHLLDLFDTNDLKHELLDLLMSPQKEVKLLKNEMPVKPTYYIERFISNRLKLNPAIFKEDIKDVFLFKGLTIVELLHLAGDNNEIIHLSDKLKNQDSKARFVLVDDEKDWMQIRDSISSPVHIICAESITASHSKNGEQLPKEYIIERVSSDSVDIWKWVQNLPKDRKQFISESEFANSVANEKAGYCICDLPGMGKSFLLAEIARQIHDNHPNRLVLLIDLLQFHKACKIQGISQRFYKDNPLEVLFKFVASSKLSEKILLAAVQNGSLEMELFFDGLDELSKDEMESCKIFLKRILDVHNNTNIYVSAKKNLRKELEETLGTIAYEILPFTLDNQVDFFKRYWKSKSKENLADWKLKIMADACLGSLYETTQSEDFMGDPLKCYFLAEVYLKQAISYSRSSSKEIFPTIPQSSHFELYEKFINGCFSNAEAKIASKTFQFDLKTLKSFHTFKALELICPEIASDYARLEGLDRINLHDSDVYFVGILVGGTNTDKNSTKFVHYTVAQNLVAEFIRSCLFQSGNPISNNHSLLSYQTLFMEAFKVQRKFNRDQFVEENVYYYAIRYVEYSFCHPLIVNFINCRIAEVDFIKDDNMIYAYVESINMIGFYNFLNACVVSNLHRLFRVVLNILNANFNLFPCIKKGLLFKDVDIYGNDGVEEKTRRRDRYHYQVPAASMLAFKAALTASVETMKQCLHLLEICNLTVEDVYIMHVEFVELHKQVNYTLFHAAGDSCEIFVFLHFWQNFKHKMPMRDLLYWLATNSLKRNGKKLESIISMCDLLIPEVFNVSNDSKNLVLDLQELATTKGVHPKILERLWELDKKSLFAHKYGENIIHLALNSMKWYFNDLCKLVLSKPNGITLFQATKEWKSPIPDILNTLSCKMLDTDLFIKILKESKLKLQKKVELADGFYKNFENHFYVKDLRFRADFKDKSDKGSTTYGECLILLAVRRNHSLQLYKKLVELGATDIFRANEGKCFRTIVAQASFVNEDLWDYYINECVPQENKYETLDVLLKHSHSAVVSDYLIDRGATKTDLTCIVHSKDNTGIRGSSKCEYINPQINDPLTQGGSFRL